MTERLAVGGAPGPDFADISDLARQIALNGLAALAPGQVWF